MSDPTTSKRKTTGKKKPVSDLATTVMAALAIALPLVLYLHEHVEILKYGYQIDSLKRQQAELQESARELSVQRAEEASLPAVASRAAAMGLIAPDPRDVHVAAGDDATEASQQSVPIQARLE